MEYQCNGCINGIKDEGMIVSCDLSIEFRNPSLLMLGFKGCCPYEEVEE